MYPYPSVAGIYSFIARSTTSRIPFELPRKKCAFWAHFIASKSVGQLVKIFFHKSGRLFHPTKNQIKTNLYSFKNSLAIIMKIFSRMRKFFLPIPSFLEFSPKSQTSGNFCACRIRVDVVFIVESLQARMVDDQSIICEMLLTRPHEKSCSELRLHTLPKRDKD